MKLLIVGDLHLRAKKLRDVESAWTSAIKWAHANHVDLVVQAGDVFDHANVYGREASTGTIYNAFLAPFADQPSPIPLFVIPGNHDLGSPRDKDALSPVDRYPWITVIRKPSIIEIDDSFSICAVPWLNRIHLISRLAAKGLSLDEATQKISSIIAQLMTPLGAEVQKQHDKGRFVLFVGHLEVTGARMPQGLFHGGSFEFTSANLKAVGADAYALAHIHLRQHFDGFPNPNDGYLGCLCQLNFGEEGNEVGCRLMEIKDRKIVVDRWLENRSSPRYFTTLSMGNVPYRQGVDYVKLRGITKPDNLPDGIMFERLPQAVQARTRIEEKLDCDLSLRTLISAWCSVSNCPIDIDVLTAEAEKLRSQCQIQSDAIGSLEMIERVKIKNITCHGSTDVKLGVKGIIGLAGPNGTGKTTFIESIMRVLYGISPSRPLPSLMPKGEVVEGFDEVSFISGGRSYRARRELSKNKKNFSQKPAVYEGDSSEALASGVEGVFSFTNLLVGDKDLVLAGVFSSQGDSGNLVRLKPAQRKDLFGKLLGTEKFLCISAAAKDIFTNDEASILAEMSRMETLKIELAVEAQDKKRLEDLLTDIGTKKADLERVEQYLATVSACLASMEQIKRDGAKKIQELADLQKKKEKIKAEGVALKQKRKELEALEGTSIDAELEEARAARDESQKVADQINDVTQKAIVVERETGSIQASRQDEYRKLADKLQTGKTKLDLLNANLKQAQRGSLLLQGFPDLKECRTCPLAKDSIDSRNNIPELEKQIKALSEKLANAEQILSDHAAETARLVAESKSRNKNVSGILDGLKSRRHELGGKVLSLPILEVQHEKILTSKAEISKIDALIENARQDYKEIEESAKSYASLPAVNETEYAGTLAERAQWQSKIKSLNAEISEMNVEIGKHKAKLEQHESRWQELSSLDVDVCQKQEKSAIYEALMKAFCRDGIPQLIVDSAIPHLQEIMFDMMSEIDGRWAIRIATQKETGKGTIQERIDLLVDDGDDERDISTYSGGEMNLLSTIIRIAFSILQAERSGKGLKVLVLDEAMYFADTEHSDAFMRMLKKLPKYFNQIFVISHSEYILSSIQNKIFFARSSNGKTTVKTDFATT